MGAPYCASVKFVKEAYGVVSFLKFVGVPYVDVNISDLVIFKALAYNHHTRGSGPRGAAGFDATGKE